MHGFSQIDVFADEFTRGNPVAVVHDAGDIPDARLAAFANWTNLSETTFLMPPTVPGADYRLRIFTPTRELPFAGHPTIGSARAWLEAGGEPQGPDEIVQECGTGLVRLRRDGDLISLAAPPLIRSGPVTEDDLAEIARALRLPRSEIVDASWCCNGPQWVGVMLRDADAVLAVRPDYPAFGRFVEIGVVGLYPAGGDADIEVRAFVGDGAFEDPVTGSLNAGLAQWMIPNGVVPPEYVASQGTALGRRGRVHVRQDRADIWIGGHTTVGVAGTVAL
jgi:PhzF family phenazine biosynthesis protein